MAEVQQSTVGPAHSRTGSASETVWLGWVLFSGIVLFGAGLLNAVQGMVALVNDDFYAVAAFELAVGIDYAVWGWTLLVLGVGLVAAGIGIVLGHAWARVVGVVVAAITAFVNLGFVAAYPFWAVLAVAFDVLIIYGLVVHGGAAKTLRIGRS